MINSFKKMPPRDYCSGIRKTYGSIVKALAINNIVASIITFIPVVYMIILGIYQAREISVYNTTSSIWIFFTTLFIAWLIGLIAMWKTMPNLLTFTIFVYKAFGYWCLITTFITIFITIFYASGYIPTHIIGYLLIAIIPSIFFLLMSADILRAVRSRMYAIIEAGVPPSTIDVQPVAPV